MKANIRWVRRQTSQAMCIFHLPGVHSTVSRDAEIVGHLLLFWSKAACSNQGADLIVQRHLGNRDLLHQVLGQRTKQGGGCAGRDRCDRASFLVYIVETLGQHLVGTLSGRTRGPENRRLRLGLRRLLWVQPTRDDRPVVRRSAPDSSRSHRHSTPNDPGCSRRYCRPRPSDCTQIDSAQICCAWVWQCGQTNELEPWEGTVRFMGNIFRHKVSLEAPMSEFLAIMCP